MRHFVLLYENIQDKEVLLPCLPTAQLHVTVTSLQRDYYWSQTGFGFVVLPLTPSSLLSTNLLAFSRA